MESLARSAARLAPAALLMFTAAAHADFTVRFVPLIRWGVGPAGVGLGDCTMEDFEDAALAPGLSITWSATAGTVGPVTTLPQTFAPVTDDPHGNAFDAGVWNGSRALISALGNQTYVYTAGQNWGDVEFSFATPQRVVGFSLQQPENQITVVVNGAPIGTLSTLAGTPATGSGRIGYFVVMAGGSDTITSLKLDNTGGDGWTIDSFLFSPDAPPAVTVTGYGPTPWPRPDEQLGVTPAFTESFEDVSLEPGLQVSWETPAGVTPPTSTLPNLFAPVTDDAFGNVFDTGPWDGTRAVLNTRDNLSHPYTGTGEWGDIAFSFSPPRRTVAFSMEQAEGPTRLLINGRDVGDIIQMAGFAADGARQGFVRVETPCGGEPISELRLNNRRIAAGGDGIAIDHLMVGSAFSFPVPPTDGAVCGATAAAYGVTVEGIGPFNYQWQIEVAPDVWMDMGAAPTAMPGGGAAAAAPADSASVEISVQGRSGPFNVRAAVSTACDTEHTPSARLFIDPADIGSTGGVPGPDGSYDNNDFVVFIDFFFSQDVRADLGRTGGVFGHDGAWNNNDFVAFIDRFFNGC
ncbi:MAG TPA: GC-type dockerin domain-anchored protein [Phycisphaerales bacterium]|nr:GC-type dockerin domain-anchored protein [Phycisphaerales bacterium]